MDKYVVIYDNPREDTVSEDKIQDLLRDHVELVKNLHSRGIIFLCGPLEDSGGKGLLIFQAGSKDEVESYVLKDPLIINKCYDSYSIYKWIEANESNNYLLDG